VKPRQHLLGHLKFDTFALVIYLIPPSAAISRVIYSDAVNRIEDVLVFYMSLNATITACKSDCKSIWELCSTERVVICLVLCLSWSFGGRFWSYLPIYSAIVNGPLL